MLRRFGYYSTESNGHLSEYVPWYRKRPDEIEEWIDLGRWINGETGGYLRVCTEGRNWFETDFPNWMKEPAIEYAAKNAAKSMALILLKDLETGRVYRGHFNVVNNGVIANLPDDAIIEAPGYVDRNGISMPHSRRFAARPAAVCNVSISVQRLAVEAAVHGDDKLLRQAFMMDPLVGAVCNPKEIWQMVDEMLVAQEQWLPQYTARSSQRPRTPRCRQLDSDPRGLSRRGATKSQNGGRDAGGPRRRQPQRGRIRQRQRSRQVQSLMVICVTLY